MKTIALMQNTIQPYAWGSRTAIAALRGEPLPSAGPQAELWIGAHPKAPSLVRVDRRWVPLPELIAADPVGVLGAAAAARFDGQLPYLLKVLAAERPLSIQAHPSRDQAREGFARENRLKIPLDAPHRNYRDANHKPECLCALTPFWGVSGFRAVPEILARLEPLLASRAAGPLADLAHRDACDGLRNLFTWLMTLPATEREPLVAAAAAQAAVLADRDPAFGWVARLQAEYPGDAGVLAPLLLNLVRLAPGEALFLPAGELHAYLQGVGIELMANSDNVLRGGLTPKHVDLPELLRVLTFEERKIEVLRPAAAGPCEGRYASRAEEFQLAVLTVDGDRVSSGPAPRSVEVLLCVEGEGRLGDLAGEGDLAVRQGQSALVPAGAG
ncbi:MAG: mannose-6-phosphate isomerase, class I, partial [Desulfobacterales bacterium]